MAALRLAIESSALTVHPRYRSSPTAASGHPADWASLSCEDWVPSIRSIVDTVIKRYAPLDLNELLDYVYFRTGPMIDAEREQQLDLQLARDDPSQRPAVPLRRGPRPEGVEERLARWRARNAQRFAPIT